MSSPADQEASVLPEPRGARRSKGPLEKQSRRVRIDNGKNREDIARLFTRWCCSLGPDFRNSPDRINLHYWMRKQGLALDVSEEPEVLETARQLFLRRIQVRTDSSFDNPGGAGLTSRL